MNIETLRHHGAMHEFIDTRISLSRKKKNNIVLADQLNNPVRLFYPAGGYDVEQLTIPSVRSLAIVDLVPFLFDHEVLENTYSPILHRILNAQQGKYITLPKLFKDPSFTAEHEEAFMKKAQSSLNRQVNRRAYVKGYAKGTDIDKSAVKEDSFVKTLMYMRLLGIDLRTVQIGKFGDDFRVKCIVDGAEKSVTFRHTQIGPNFSYPDSENYLWTQDWLNDGEEGGTALVVKADMMHVARHTINAVNPDVVFGNGGSMTAVKEDVVPAPAVDYLYLPVRGLPFSKEGWGYEQYGTIEIGMPQSTLLKN